MLAHVYAGALSGQRTMSDSLIVSYPEWVLGNSGPLQASASAFNHGAISPAQILFWTLGTRVTECQSPCPREG